MSAFVPTRPSGIPMILSGAVSHHRRPAAAAVVSVALLAAIFGARLLWPPRGELAELRGLDTDKAVVALKSTRAERRLGFITLTGTMVNQGDNSLRNVEAVVEYFDTARNLVRVDSALIEVPNLMSAGESGFEVHSRDSAEIKSYRVRFRSLLGGSIPSSRE